MMPLFSVLIFVCFVVRTAYAPPAPAALPSPADRAICERKYPQQSDTTIQVNIMCRLSCMTVGDNDPRCLKIANAGARQEMCTKRHNPEYDSVLKLNQLCRSQCLGGNHSASCIELVSCYEDYVRYGDPNCIDAQCNKIGRGDTQCQRLEPCHKRFPPQLDVSWRENKGCRNRCVEFGNVDERKCAIPNNGPGKNPIAGR